ncbi:hypothetical protein [Plantibacter sp. YIM 135347]
MLTLVIIVSMWLLIVVVSLIVLYLIIRGAVLSALRKHSRETAEGRIG